MRRSGWGWTLFLIVVAWVLAALSCANPRPSWSGSGLGPGSSGAAQPPIRLEPGEVAIEYIAHACFLIHSSAGTRVLIDPYASRVWLGYDFPKDLAADAVLITHPHFDHDAGAFMGRDVSWLTGRPVRRDPGTYTVAGMRVRGVRGKHADPYGKEFGQKNTIWLLEVGGLRIVHLGDNGPLTEAIVSALGRVDVLMIPIDSQYHILSRAEITEIRRALQPRVLIPMHYRHPELERSKDSPGGLGPIDPWLAREKNVRRLRTNTVVFSAATLPADERIVVLDHSPRVRAP